MSEERVRKFLESTHQDLVRQSAGHKHLKEAEALFEKGEIEKAEKKLAEAANAFIQSAQEYRDGMSFKKSAFIMCTVGDVFSDIGDSQKAIDAYSWAAEDLYNAAKEHLLWDEPKETKHGTVLAVTATMILIMIGKDSTGFQKARTFAAENAAKLRFPDIIRLSQIPQQLESALQSLDLVSFSAAENAAVTELRTALFASDAQQLSKYVDKGLEMVRETLRGKLKVPKISSQLELPVDMTFSEQFLLKVIIQNTGEGQAFDLNTEWHLDPELTLVSGETTRTMPTFGPGDSFAFEIIAKASKELMGTKDYSVMLRGSYRDQLRTEYSLQAGPGILILKDFKEGEQLQHDLDVTDGRIGLLKTSIQQSQYEKLPLEQITSGLSKSLMKARDEIIESKIKSAKSRISVVNELVDTIDEVIGDETSIAQLLQQRKESAKTLAMDTITGLSKKIDETISQEESDVQAKTETAKTEWMSEDSARKEVVEAITSAKTMLGELIQAIESIQSKLPTASSTSDPSEAAERTKIRTAVEESRTKLDKIHADISGLLVNDFLIAKKQPDVPEKIQMTLDSLAILRSRLKVILESTKSEI